VPNPDRLTALDSSFLHLERDASSHMHVGSVLTFEGPAPTHEELIAAIERRLHLVPRYRQRLAFVPLEQGRPVWVDDPHFNPAYHVRHTALPRPRTDVELKRLAGRLFSQRLDRDKPLWEIWLVQGLQGGRFALVVKTHHCLVDGVSGVDIATVLFDSAPDASVVTERERSEAEPWIPRPAPTDTQLLADAWLERSTMPSEMVRGLRAMVRGPQQALAQAAGGLAAVTRFARAGGGAPTTPLNVRIGPHRRFTWVDADLDTFKQIKDQLEGTVNDVVLTVVTLALRRFLRRRGEATEGLELKAMVPVSVRAEAEYGALGNRVAAMWAPLPVGVDDPSECFQLIHSAMAELKSSGQAVGATVLTNLAGFAPPTIMAQAARLQARQRFFNLVVTNVPGPQFPLYLLGRKLHAMYPQVPLVQRQALGIAILSYDGGLHFGLLGDFDAMPDLDETSQDLAAAIEELALAAGVETTAAQRAAAADRPPLGFEMPRTRGGGRTRASAGRSSQ
jgi:WS/DGAT/MGAT family acyltransferase